MLETSYQFYQISMMKTPAHSIWTILTVSVTLMCVYSIQPECQKLVTCTEELLTLNQTISTQVGTSQMIRTCVNLRNLPPCFLQASSDCSLTFKQSIPYRIAYSSVQESCNHVCPIFPRMSNCETKVSYVDLSTNKNSYCRSYRESMQCLETILENVTCSFGEQTRMYILENVYDQGARQFGDGVCMTARNCSDIDKAVTAVNLCLLEWNATRDYSDSGTDALKSCISKIPSCTDALRMVPYYERSLVGIDVTVPPTTETPETTSEVTTEVMTSSVKSPSFSTMDDSVQITPSTGQATDDDTIKHQPSRTTETTDSKSSTHTTSSSNSTSKFNTTKTNRFQSTKSSTSEARSIPITTSPSNQISSSQISSTYKMKSIESITYLETESDDPYTTKDTLVLKTSTSSPWRASAEYVPTESLNEDRSDGVSLEAGSQQNTVQNGMTTVRFIDRSSTTEGNGPWKNLVSTSIVPKTSTKKGQTTQSKREVTLQTTKAYQYTVSSQTAMSDGYHGDREMSAGVHVTSSLPAIKTAGGEITRKQHLIQVESTTSSLLSSKKTDSVTMTTRKKSVSSSETLQTTSPESDEKPTSQTNTGAQSGGTNGSGPQLRSTTSVWVLTALSFHALTCHV
ncbi:serine-rich adhesin for platelets-like isoform X1 [Argopecten irradians]|uniref:serine-rich adhesin for platelets-like isoform X1 n=1 Tax=Argopecten irradians TaxID=31199 RepID=UPI00371CF641